jgi:hypothetical protein
MADNDIIVLNVAGFVHNAEECSQLPPADRKLCGCIITRYRSNAFRVSVVGLPGVQGGSDKSGTISMLHRRVKK